MALTDHEDGGPLAAILDDKKYGRKVASPVIGSRWSVLSTEGPIEPEGKGASHRVARDVPPHRNKNAGASGLGEHVSYEVKTSVKILKSAIAPINGEELMVAPFLEPITAKELPLSSMGEVKTEKVAPCDGIEAKTDGSPAVHGAVLLVVSV